jgi:predicted acetyltransferase
VDQGPHHARYLGWIDGQPVASAAATFGVDGALLNGAAVDTRFRGRGAYRALVHACWRDAERRGAPLLVTQAGSMSAPILGRLGFRTIGEITSLIDPLGTR